MIAATFSGFIFLFIFGFFCFLFKKKLERKKKKRLSQRYKSKQQHGTGGSERHHRKKTSLKYSKASASLPRTRNPYRSAKPAIEIYLKKSINDAENKENLKVKEETKELR